MNKHDFDFSFRKTFASLKPRDSLTSNDLFQKELGVSEINSNNTSRFEEKKVLRRLREQDLLNRM